MKKILVALLLVSTVMAMSMPGMADPRININKTVDLAQHSANTAANTVAQTLDNSGDETNTATVVALGGAAGAFSQADGTGSATNSGSAKIMNGDNSKDPKVNAGNTHSGNADAHSSAYASGGDGTNGDVDQSNSVAQAATAVVLTEQDVNQNIWETEIFIPTVNVDRSIFDNTLGDDNLVELGCNTCR